MSLTKLTVATVMHALLVALAAVASYALVADLIGPAISWDSGTEQLGGMWAAVATLFCFRDSYAASVDFALSRMSATLTSFVLCTVYLLLLPFSPWGMALVVVVGALILTAVGRSEDIITTSITTVVVLVVASLASHDRWAQPLLRLLDTAVGVAVGVVAAWCALWIADRAAARSTTS